MLADEMIGKLELVREVAPGASPQRFPDGAHFRIEIPSVEGPRVLEAVLHASERHGVTVNRVSQGSGAMLLSRRELREMAELGAEHGIEVSLFVGPREEYGVGSYSRSEDGPSCAGQLRALRQLRYGIEDVARSVEEGIRSFLVADLGLLDLLRRLQEERKLPQDLVWKSSVAMAPSNPASLRVLERLGASTINIPSDVTLGQLAEFRSASDLPLDLYVESPDAMSGVVRGQESAELIWVGAPLYVKFGLRNARSVYPSGEHLEQQAAAMASEKVHRAAVAMEWLARLDPSLVQSGPGAKGLGVPALADRSADGND